MKKHPKSEICVRCPASAICFGMGRKRLFEQLVQCDACNVLVYKCIAPIRIACAMDWWDLWIRERTHLVGRKCPACGSTDFVEGWLVKYLGARVRLSDALEGLYAKR